MATRVKGLAVSPALILPRDAVTQSFALLAIRRAGKSNAGAVMAEEMHHAGLPWVAIDPKGDWWGLRSSRDGKGDGLPVPIFGGLHGDMPLLPEAAKLIAELIVDQNLTCILDVSDFPSKAAEMRFLTDFAQHLFRLHRKNPHPRHIFLEEADDYLPQRVMQDQAKCVGAWTRLVKQGGAFGLGVTLISQRSAVVNKDALTQVETLIALRTTSPQDRAAIKAWTDYHDTSREIVDSLPGLEDGEAWVISPNWLARHGQPAVQRVRFRQRATFDSAATPTMATAAQRPATLADIDLGAILDRMESVAEQAANDDPVALRRRITSLERQLAAKPGTTPDREAAKLREQIRDLTAALDEARNRPPERVEVPVFGPGDIAALEQYITGARDVAGSLELVLSRATALATAKPAAAAALPRRAAAKPAPPPAAPRDIPGLRAGERAMLEALARQYPLKTTRAQLGSLSGFAPRGGTFRTYLGTLLRAGLVARDGDYVTLTDAGMALTGTDGRPPVTAEEIRETWRRVLRAGERAMLDILIDRWPEPVGRGELAELTGFEVTGGTFRTYLGTLRRNGLAGETSDGIRADDVFFLTDAADA
jgi:hypothetical protein